jgi:predicted amidohydrolase
MVNGAGFKSNEPTPPSSEFAAALVQMAPAHLDAKTNVDRMVAFIRQAAGHGARLIVFPELVVTGYILPYDPAEKRRFYETAEPIPGPTTDRIAGLSEELGVHIVFGTAERRESLVGPVMHNTSVMVAPDRSIAVHRKVHLPGDEKLYFQPGNEISVFDTALGKISLLVCYDFWFPESTRIAGLKGAQIIIDSANWPAFDTDTWFALGPGVAASNVLWLIQVNRVGGEDHWPGFGGSQIIAPSGKVVVRAGGEEGITYGAIDPSAVEERRILTPVWFDRRPELYGPVAREIDPFPADQKKP